MSSRLSHRGPDDSGIFSDHNARVGMAHRRLSIIDLTEAGKQPMSDPDRKVYIVYNGEIYNYKELRSILEKSGYKFKSSTDTEVLLNAYLEYGKDCLRMLNGMFAFAIWDTRSGELFIARDRFGIKPLYYYVNGNQLVFSSELKSIMECPEINHDINYAAICSFLTFQYTPIEDAIFKGVKKLLPGHYIVHNSSGLTVKKYYNPFDESVKNTARNPIPELRNRLSNSVQLRLRADVPIGVMLSGGIDSSILTYLAQNSSDNINTYTIGFGRKDDEFDCAGEVASLYNTNHHELIINPEDAIQDIDKIVYYSDEPFAEPGIIPHYLICKKLSGRIKVLIFGEGADEIFGGYPWHKIGLRQFDFLPRSLRSKLFFKMISWHNPKHNGFSSDRLFSKLFETRNHKNAFFQDMMKYEINYHLPCNHLHKIDRMTMAHSIEGRVPFLDHNVVELALSLKDRDKISAFSNKLILRSAFSGTLPPSILKRKKRGFLVPFSHWLKNEMKEISHDTLFSGDSFARELYTEKELNALYQNAGIFEQISRDALLSRLFFLDTWKNLYRQPHPKSCLNRS